ncbi:hypothetical protein C8R44DRAFT_975935 [Mycena epipterygia]|nr:hypothetical protein C8R44DRAFT_975935 [Mycena epipterygia]
MGSTPLNRSESLLKDGLQLGRLASELVPVFSPGSRPRSRRDQTPSALLYAVVPPDWSGSKTVLRANGGVLHTILWMGATGSAARMLLTRWPSHSCVMPPPSILPPTSSRNSIWPRLASHRRSGFSSAFLPTPYICRARDLESGRGLKDLRLLDFILRPGPESVTVDGVTAVNFVQRHLPRGNTGGGRSAAPIRTMTTG